MPELPDITVYRERLEALAGGQVLEELAIDSPFLLRSVAPLPQAVVGERLQRVGRIGKRLVLSFENDVHLVLHLMIAGRLRWRAGGRRPPARPLAKWRFASGTLVLTEAGSHKRASLHVVAGERELAAFDRGGVDVLVVDAPRFVAALRQRNHTLKRALTDPRIVDGIGNAYSDEILWAARMAPTQWTKHLTDADGAHLHATTRTVLGDWIERLRAEVGAGFPEHVTAFHEQMAVHGRYRQPCPACGAPIQRIRYATNESNYCARCQTGGRLLADRALSRLMREDWPKTLEELEERRHGG